ncbi:MAG: hypothetical protein NDJ89_08355 [Oligoflexia bacterium]|nr:hypothetical protein [Oligoflexia bacterium]
MKALLSLFLTSLYLMQAAHAGEKLELWPYIDSAAVQDERDRKLEGVSYLVGGAVAISLPYITTTSGSTLRDIGNYTLVPAGIYSVLYGGYTVLTDSPWTTLKKRVERLSGPEEDSAQWRLRREGHSRQVLLERADSVRFRRYLWGGVELGAGALLINSSQSTASIATASILFGLSAYHLFHKKAEERLVDSLDRTTTVAGITPTGDIFLACQIPF